MDVRLCKDVLRYGRRFQLRAVRRPNNTAAIVVLASFLVHLVNILRPVGSASF